MEIEEHISRNGAALKRWGDHISAVVVSGVGSLLKVPASVRVKDPESARVKQLKKGYSNPVLEMTDQVGTRFVVLTRLQVEEVCKFIESRDGWSVQVARDPALEMAQDPATFGYQSHHYEVRPAAEFDTEGLGEFPLCCEVQVRTLLQHAYAELTHDTMYKPSQTVPSHAERLVARSMALMETTDDLLCQAIEAVSLANEPVEALYYTAKRLTSRLGEDKGRPLYQAIVDEFRDIVSPRSAVEISRFLEARPFILERIGGRLDHGLFAYPAVALVAYWIAHEVDCAAERWPLPTTTGDVETMMSDLGF